LIVFVVMLEWG